MIFSFLLFIFQLINLKAQNISIDFVDPLSFKINIETVEVISMTLILNEDIKNRSSAKILLSKSEKNYEFEASTNQDEHNLKKVEFTIDKKEFYNNYGKYNLTYINNEINIEYNQIIFIYNNDLILKHPINRYELTEDISYNRTVKYEFQNIIVEDEINRIEYFDNSNQTIRNILSKNNYKLEEGKKLIITFPGTSKASTYLFDIYPEYDKNNSNAAIHRFYLHFHDYLLKNEAIYIDKQTGSNLVSFITLLKQNYSSNPFTISDSGQNINCSTFSCSKSDANYLCNCSLNFTRRNSPGKIIITHKINQIRDLFLILYTNYMKLCYDKSEIEDLIINMEWIDEMEYDHYLYFLDSEPKPLTPSFSGKNNSIISYSYKISTLSLSTGPFNLESSIPSLNFTDYNLVDKTNLFIYIYPNIQLTNPITSFIFSHNLTSQIVNLTINDYEASQKLDEIVLKKDDDDLVIINVSKTKGQCTPKGNSFICDFKNIIYDYEDEKNGNYSIYYNSICNNENKNRFEGGFVIIKRGLSLLSISPIWINKTTFDGNNITLTYDYIINQRISICLYNNQHPISKDSCLQENSYYLYNSTFKRNESIIITLKNIDAGFYHILTYVYENSILDNDKIEIINDSLGFKISDDNIIFEFNHHYFVLNNNGDINKLIIKVNVTSGEFGCGIIEDSSKQNLSSINCSYFEYQIEKEGTIKFSYYDNDRFIIPINDYINVAKYYNQLFSYISLKTCYYHNNFEILIDIDDFFENKFQLYLYLRSIDNNTDFKLDRLNNINKYILKEKSNLLFNNSFYLYVSENYYDYETFLHKSEDHITFTNINTQPFIIEPNTKIIFSDIRCDLSNSIFIMKKEEDNLQKKLDECKYNNSDSQISCNITGKETFYSNNYNYKNYYYTIDNKNIIFFNNNSNEKTFVSKKLNETIFNIKENFNGNDFTIENPNKDFYFPLLENLTIYKNENGINNTITYTRNSTNFKIDNDNYKIEFNDSLELNQIFYIDHLIRKTEIWEADIDNNTLFHYFNYKVYNRISIIPNIFAYNNISEKEYPIQILFANEKHKQKYNSYINLRNCTEQNNIVNFDLCIDLEEGNFTSNAAQNFVISIGDGEKYANMEITFIYYKLSDESKKCQTKTDNMNNTILYFYFPDNSLINKFNINPEISILNISIVDNKIIYTLNSSEIIIPYTYIYIYIQDKIFYHSFTLQEIGLNVAPKYNLSLINNENIIYLFPNTDKEQKVVIYLSSENNENSKIDDINGFIIKNGNIRKVLDIEKINDNFANIKFKNISSSNYTLYYIDRCGNEIKTDIKIQFYSFNIKRKYFILNNNANNNEQYLIIEEQNSNSNINIIIQKDGLHAGIMDYNSTLKYYTILDKNSQGNYTFYVSKNGIESPINGIVYVRNNLEDLFIINIKLPKCLFLDEDKNELGQINYTIFSKDETINDISIFISKFTINNLTFSNLSQNGNLSHETFILNYKTNNNSSDINIGENLYIYLTENGDHNQPIFVFKYKYTNIKLNSEFAKVIYTDSDYIFFNMSCKIDNIEPFYLINSNNNYKINCEEKPYNYNEESKIYKCFLSLYNKQRNELLTFGATTFEYIL